MVENQQHMNYTCVAKLHVQFMVNTRAVHTCHVYVMAGVYCIIMYMHQPQFNLLTKCLGFRNIFLPSYTMYVCMLYVCMYTCALIVCMSLAK